MGAVMSRFLAGLMLTLLAAGNAQAEEDGYAKLRRRMVEAIRSDVVWTSQHIQKTRLDPRVMDVMGKVPRHELVPAQIRYRAYENRPLPIGYGQTISQPYIVALMTELLGLERGERVLEIGTGSAYQAAVLAELVDEVYSIEIVPELAESAAQTLRELGYNNVRTKQGDGYSG